MTDKLTEAIIELGKQASRRDLGNTEGARDGEAMRVAEQMAGALVSKWTAVDDNAATIAQALIFVAVRLTMALEREEVDDE